MREDALVIPVFQIRGLRHRGINPSHKAVQICTNCRACALDHETGFLLKRLQALQGWWAVGYLTQTSQMARGTSGQAPLLGPSNRACYPPLTDRLGEVRQPPGSHLLCDSLVCRPSPSPCSGLCGTCGVPKEGDLGATDHSPSSPPPLCPASSHRSHEEGLPGGAEPRAEQNSESPAGPRRPPEAAPVRGPPGSGGSLVGPCSESGASVKAP